jgi:soluble lytic murein transglycosylase-like protein
VSIGTDISVVERRLMQLGAGSEAGGAASPAIPRRFAALVTGETERLVRRAAQEGRVDPALALAVTSVESGFDPRALSAAGAVGLMQLMPATAQALGVKNPYDPMQNARGGATYLRELLARFGGDLPSALAAYNAGPGAVERYGGVPPPETREYVARVLAAYRAYRIR